MNPIENESHIPLDDYFTAFAELWGMDLSAARLVGLACVSAVAGPSVVIEHPLEKGEIPVSFSFILHAPSPLVARSALTSALMPVFDWIETMTKAACEEGRNRTQLRLVKAHEDVLRREFAATQPVPTDPWVPQSTPDSETAPLIAEELEQLRNEISLGKVQLKPSFLTRDLDVQTLLKPWEISLDDTVAHLGDGRSLQQWLKLERDEALDLQMLFNVSWSGGILHRGAAPRLGRISHLIGGEQDEIEELLPKVARCYPGILDQLVVASTGKEGKIAESELTTDQWRNVLDGILKRRISGEVHRYRLSPEARCLFLQVYNSALSRRCPQRAPLLSLKFAALLQSMGGASGPSEISDSVFTHALRLALCTPKDEAAPGERASCPPLSPMEILVAKVRAKEPVTLRQLVRSYSNQKTGTIRKLLEEAIKQGFVIREGNQYRGLT